MRGITHYLVALGTAACLPGVMERAAAGDPWGLVLGGLGGLAPDFLDFKLWRYIPRSDIEIAPDPLAPDARMVAEAIGLAATRAFQGNGRQLVRLHPVRLDASTCIPYDIDIDASRRTLSVAFDFSTTAGRTPSTPQHAERHEIQLPGDVTFDYYRKIEVRDMEGPLLAIARKQRPSLTFQFLPWHRSWSHSLLLAGMLGLMASLWCPPIDAIALALGWSSHILLDQLGTMGCNLLWPLSRSRHAGLAVAASDSTTGNFFAAWTACWVLLARAGTTLYRPPFGPVSLFRIWATPLAFLLTIKFIRAIRQRL